MLWECDHSHCLSMISSNLTPHRDNLNHYCSVVSSGSQCFHLMKDERILCFNVMVSHKDLLLFLNFIYLFLAVLGFAATRGLSLVVASGGYSSLWCTGFSLQWLLLLRSTGSRCTGCSSCGTWAQQLWFAGSRAQAQ